MTTVSAPTDAVPATTTPLDTVVHTHGEGEHVKRTMVIAVDHSKNSDVAFHWALDNFLDATRDVAVLLNVRSVPTAPGLVAENFYIDFSDYLSRIEEKNRAESHQLLHYYADQVKARGIAVRAVAMVGDPREAILSKCKELHADGLVMGCRGLGSVRRAFLGSVSDYLVHHIKCPIMIIRDPSSEGSSSKTAKPAAAAQKVNPTDPATVPHSSLVDWWEKHSSE
ncbi:hypothetical protein HK104_009044 [Borealophlyctis nickersoniae]|nr:hypothetical protein HK104_009044 [Borealophlyctis nickersoniae]